MASPLFDFLDLSGLVASNLNSVSAAKAGEAQRTLAERMIRSPHVYQVTPLLFRQCNSSPTSIGSVGKSAVFFTA
jgi:hypothetical protein